jgi:hypothetical protein
MEGEQQYEWELSKENVQPVRSGRKVQTLSNALAGALQTRRGAPEEVETKIAYV